MSAQQSATITPTMRFLELIAMNPRVKGLSIAPTCNHDDLILTYGAKDLQRDEARELLYETPTIREALDYLVGHPLFHRQSINDSRSQRTSLLLQECAPKRRNRWRERWN